MKEDTVRYKAGQKVYEELFDNFYGQERKRTTIDYEKGTKRVEKHDIDLSDFKKPITPKPTTKQDIIEHLTGKINKNILEQNKKNIISDFTRINEKINRNRISGLYQAAITARLEAKKKYDNLQIDTSEVKELNKTIKEKTDKAYKSKWSETFNSAGS